MDSRQLVEYFADPNEIVSGAYGCYSDINYYGKYGYRGRNSATEKHQYDPRLAFMDDFKPFLDRVCDYINQLQDRNCLLLATRSNTVIIPTEAVAFDDPITEEILLLNGFEKAEESTDIISKYIFIDGVDSVQQTVVEYMMYSQPIEGVTSLLKCRTGVENAYGVNSVHMCNVAFVFQLQNALRLIGINKTIIPKQLVDFGKTDKSCDNTV